MYLSIPVGFVIAIPCRRSLNKVCSCLVTYELFGTLIYCAPSPPKALNPMHGHVCVSPYIFRRDRASWIYLSHAYPSTSFPGPRWLRRPCPGGHRGHHPLPVRRQRNLLADGDGIRLKARPEKNHVCLFVCL